MEKRVQDIFRESIIVKQDTLLINKKNIVRAAQMIAKAFKKRKKVFIFGNGGSAADSQHIAAEFVGRFQKERKALPAIALTTDTSALTALGNDYSFDIVFSRQLEALAQRGDVAIGISTSGNSKNVINGIKAARRLGLSTIAITGNNGGKLAKMSDISIDVPSKVTARIQESHLCIYHSICELVEAQFS